MFRDQTWWIIGASEGLGRALAVALDAEGATLVLSARNEDRLTGLAASLGSARALAMDVTDRESVARAAQEAGAVDGVIYCVGLYEPMSATDWQPDLAERMADANYLGALRVLSHVLPGFVRRNRGQVLLIGSLSGFYGLPGAIGYADSKAALRQLAEGMAMDLRKTNVRIAVANPGFIKTRLTDKNDFKMPGLMTPEDAAARVIKGLRAGRFSTSFPAPFSWLFTVGRFLPRSLRQALF